MPVKVFVRAGKYFLDRCLELTQIDSGITAAPVLYASDAGEKVVISGGVQISGWTRYHDQIMQANLPAGEWAVGKCRQLTFNGQLQTRACWPNFDANINPVIGAYLNIEDAAEPGSDTAFRYQQGALPRAWKKSYLAEAMVTVAGGWATNVVPAARVDRKERVITLQRQTWHSENHDFVRYRHMPFRPLGTKDVPFVMENILEELDQSGEWVLDTEERVIYFWLPSPITSAYQVVLPQLDCLVDLHNTSHVTISGFTFSETTSGDNYHPWGLKGYGAMFPVKGWDCGHAVHLEDTVFFRINGFQFYALGGNAVYLEKRNLKTRFNTTSSSTWALTVFVSLALVKHIPCSTGSQTISLSEQVVSCTILPPCLTV